MRSLINRIINKPKRPIAFNSTKSELFDMIKKRSNFYSKAMYKINCNNLTKSEISTKILDIYENNKIIIKTKTQKYPILIGSNIISKFSKILNQNSIKFKQCLF